MPQMSPLSWSTFLISFSFMLLSAMVILFFYHLTEMSKTRSEKQPQSMNPIMVWKW